MSTLPPLPRGKRMGSGVINGKLIELFMHDDAAMLAYATAALSAQATEVEALRADAERYRTMLDNLELLVLRTEKGSTLTLTAKQRGAKFTRRGTDATLDGLGAALKEQTPND